MEITVAEEPLFSFSKLKFFIDSAFNTLIREEKDLPAPSSTPSVIYPEVENDSNQLSLSFSDDNSLLLQRSIRICHKPTRYSLIAHI